MRFNSLLSDLTLIFDHKQDMFTHLDNPSEVEEPWPVLGLLHERTDPITLGMKFSLVSDSLELYVRRMIGACACSIYIPAHGRSMWAAPQRIKSLLSPSSRKRIKFIDRRHNLWKDIQEYFRPVATDLSRQLIIHSDSNLRSLLNKSVWDLYLLALATKNHCEAPLASTQAIDRIDTLIVSNLLSNESKSRLSIVRGLFALFANVQEIPGFQCITNLSYHSLKERLDEILDDAYLLEASCLRRFLGLKANVKAIMRDLRKLVQFIVKNRPWAKGVLSAASQTAALPTIPGETAEKFLEALPGLQNNCSVPVLVDPQAYILSHCCPVNFSQTLLTT